ncbi:MarC family protein [Caulobacter sp. SL161]|uniref:MarC family protein n=1 Tax=Caulobacter sp. SL161 TaxID=2995156 RepID=UPI0022756A1B|nr:MarC family protein [Caulobacter sp. SL161]MCY1646159.1 MarC family protein [Caulobacter sp. SL161]
MTEANLAVNFFVALFALIDPIGNVPLFAAATLGAAAAGRRMVAVYIGLFMAAFLIFFYFTGVGLLEFFGISMPAFRIAGGIILFILGLDMVRDDFTTMFADAAEGIEDQSPRAYAKQRFERLIVPFAMPLLIGPGSISTVIIYAAEAKDFGAAGMGIGVAVIAAVSLVTVLTFWASPLVSKLLGRIGMSIVVRVLGLILCALAVQFVLVGVADATRGLIKNDAKAPYAASHK